MDECATADPAAGLRVEFSEVERVFRDDDFAELGAAKSRSLQLFSVMRDDTPMFKGTLAQCARFVDVYREKVLRGPTHGRTIGAIEASPEDD